jgi:hypothetical protein
MRHPMRLHQHAQHILHEQTCKLRHISALAFSFVLASHAFSRNFLVNSTVLRELQSQPRRPYHTFMHTGTVSIYRL